VLLVAACWRTNLTLRQLAPLFGVSKSAADRIVDRTGPLLALRQRKRFRHGTVLTWTGRWCRRVIIKVAEQPKNCGYSTNRQVAIDADPCVVVASAARFRATATSARRGPSRVPRGRWAGRPPSPTVATGGPD